MSARDNGEVMQIHMNMIRMVKRMTSVLDRMDELVTFNSDDEFDNFQTEMVDLQDETEYDGIVVEG